MVGVLKHLEELMRWQKNNQICNYLKSYGVTASLSNLFHNDSELLSNVVFEH